MENNLIIIFPCFNEKEVLPTTLSLIKDKLKMWTEDGTISQNSRVVFVDDGSTDETWSIIKAATEMNREFVGIKLSHNRGHQNALMAGLMYAKEKCNYAITLDVDLQDDLDIIPEMIGKYNQGCQIVYGVRSERKKDSFFKKTTAQLFYKLMNHFGAETVYNHADYVAQGTVLCVSQWGSKPPIRPKTKDHPIGWFFRLAFIICTQPCDPVFRQTHRGC